MSLVMAMQAQRIDLKLKYRKYKLPFFWKTTLTTPKQSGDFVAKRSQSMLMQWPNQRNRPDFSLVIRLIQKAWGQVLPFALLILV
jgi:hypothetical protein